MTLDLAGPTVFYAIVTFSNGFSFQNEASLYLIRPVFILSTLLFKTSCSRHSHYDLVHYDLVLAAYSKVTFFVWDRVSCTPSWPQSPSAAEDDLEILIRSLHLSSGGITGMYHKGLAYAVLEIEPGALCVLGKHTTKWATACFQSYLL